MSPGTISDQEDRRLSVTPLYVLTEVLREKTEGGLAHTGQNQRKEVSGERTKSCIQLAKLVAYLQAAKGTMGFSAPTAFALRADAGAHFIFKVDGLTIALFQPGKDFF